MNITWDFLKTNWKWFTLAGCIILSYLFIRQTQALEDCKKSLNKPDTTVSQFQVITQTAEARVIIKWRDKAIPCPDVEINTSTQSGQVQTQTVTQTAKPVIDGIKVGWMVGLGYEPFTSVPHGTIGADIGSVSVWASHPVKAKFNPIVWAGYHF